LIVNADDFGRSPGVNHGVIRCHEQGIVTSASLMVRWDGAGEAAAYAQRGSLAVGLHLDLGEWVYRDEEWRVRYEVLARETPQVVEAEVVRQLERFERLVGRPPSHLDSHQHVHREEPARAAVLRIGKRLNVPVREFTPGIAYSGAFYGQDGKGASRPEAITVEALVETIGGLPVGVTELGCHPATEVDHDSSYGRERLQEVETLCDPRIRVALERSGVVLRSFAELAVR
jgi:predicted glycoside hydrolase/deacetylase ChbG (UPF0249 family)